MPYILHVAGLPNTLSESGLRILFAPFGTVKSARLVKDLDGDSIGFGIVEMSCEAEVEEILNTRDRIAPGGKHPHIWRPPTKLTLGSSLQGT
jgi:RNA recognition motif-containing protein